MVIKESKKGGNCKVEVLSMRISHFFRLLDKKMFSGKSYKDKDKTMF